MDLHSACEEALKKGEVKVARAEWRDSEGNLERYLRFQPEQEHKSLFRKKRLVRAHWVMVERYVEIDEEEVGVSIPTVDFNAKDWFVVP